MERLAVGCDGKKKGQRHLGSCPEQLERTGQKAREAGVEWEPVEIGADF